MLESLRSSIGLLVTRMRFRKSRDAVISFTRSVSSADQALVVLPFGDRAHLPEPGVFVSLRNRFADERITLVGDERCAALSAQLPRSRFVRVAPSDLTVLFLPRRSLMESIMGRRYDLALDLNLDLVLPSAYICRRSDARVRVGLERGKADRFYNFLIHPDPSLGTQRLYERMLACLEMF
jgi:ADP-heptose:LPS heptosyltransferase